MAMFSGVKVKEEPGEDFKEVTDEHVFSIQFEARDNRPYEIDGEEFQTVLDAIRSIDDHPARDWPDKNLLIQRKIDGRNFTIATHSPCCFIKEKEKLIVSKRKDTVEEARENRNVFSADSYSVFYIDSEGAKNTRTERLFISTQRQGLKPLCVYGEKGKRITVKKAFEQDGRFKLFSSFKLIDCNNGHVLKSSALVDKLHEREFKIELPKENPTNDSKKSKSRAASAKKPKSVASAAALERRTNGTPTSSNMAAQSSSTAVAPALSKQRGISVKRALSQSSSDAHREQIKKILREQFLELKELMESRFTAESFQKELSEREKNFEQMHQSYRMFYRHERVTRNGKLVCKVVAGNVTGTGFVLIDNFIMTSAHLFKTEGVDVHVIFNYEDPETENSRSFKVENGLICSTEGELDYAVLVVNHEVFMRFIQIKQAGDDQFPAGLLERVGKMPKNGEACIIGHPGGEVKQIELTFIIEMENREQAAGDNLPQYKGKPYRLFVEQVKNQGIERIMVGGADAEKVITYNTFMYHGASGSPVFDAQGSLCGLHTAGFFFGPEEAKEYVMEFAYPMETIIKHLVMTLREKNETGLFERMKKVAGKNAVLREIFGSNNQPV